MAQVNSPYSRYGLGNMADRSMGFNKGMAAVAQGMRNGQQINTANPASYAAVDSLTALFDLGFTTFNGNYKMGQQQKNVRNTSFDYFAFQFRARKRLGVTIGIQPFTNIHYSFSSQSQQLTNTESTTSAYTFTGSGGTHKVFLGAGWQPLKPLSIGANVSYLYGDYSHISTMSLSQSTAYNMVRSYTADISTYTVDAGLQYTVEIGKKDKIILGATYGLGHDINNKAYRTTSTQTVTTSSISTSGTTTDTLYQAFQLPASISAGITYQHGTKWRVGADFLLEKWSQSRFPSQITDGTGIYQSVKGQLNDYQRLSLGAEYTPESQSRHLLSRCSYRFGGYYANTYAKTDLTGVISDKPYEYGLTAGISIPIHNRHIWYNSPQLNISAAWSHANIPYLSALGKNQQNLTENYLRLSIGLTFSERWFFKWKVQ